MSIKFLSDFKALAHYDAASGSFVVDSELNGWLTVDESATIGAGGNPEGVNFALKVVYKDANYENNNFIDFERCIATYSKDVNGVVSFERVSVAARNSGFDGVFDSGVANLMIYGVLNPEAVHTSDVRVLQEDLFQDYKKYEITDFSSLTNQASAILKITPKEQSSRLICRHNCNLWLNSTVAATNEIRGRLSFSYRKAVGAGYSTIGMTSLHGQAVTGPGDATEFHYMDTNLVARFNHSHLNEDGQWEIMMVAKLDYANNVMRVQNTFFEYRELLG